MSPARRSYQEILPGPRAFLDKNPRLFGRRDKVFPPVIDHPPSINPQVGGAIMKIVVIGGTGLIGSKVVSNLRQVGHEVIAASPKTGVDTITGEGLAEAVAGAQVVVD